MNDNRPYPDKACYLNPWEFEFERGEWWRDNCVYLLSIMREWERDWDIDDIEFIAKRKQIVEHI